jgi:hypothetical protein
MGKAPAPFDRLVGGGHLRRRLGGQVAFGDEPLHQLVEELGELGLALGVVLAAQRLEHLGRELATLQERVEDRLAERVHRAVALVAELPPVIRLLRPAGEPGLEQEVRELVEQRLEVDRVGEVGAELRVGVGAHDLEYPSKRQMRH